MIGSANPNAVIFSGAALLAAIIGLIGALAWHGTITGPNAMEAIIAIIGIAGGAIAHASGVNAGASAAATNGTAKPLPPA